MPARKEEPYPWIRRGDETETAYEGFQAYLRMGPGRSIVQAAAKLGKTRQALEKFSKQFDWVARVTAYDEYVMTADTDGLAHDMAVARDENLALVRKLRGHLSNRLDEFIERRQDPSIRWTQALAAMAKLEANAFLIRDDSKTTEKIEGLIEKVERLAMGVDSEPLG